MRVYVLERMVIDRPYGNVIAAEPTIARARFQAETDRAKLRGDKRITRIEWLEAGTHATADGILPGYRITTWDVEEIGR